MRTIRLGALAIALSLAIAQPVAAIGPGSSGDHAPVYYVSVGDSLAAGVQPIGDPADMFRTNAGYADQLYAIAKSWYPNLQLVKLGCPGETTGTMINGGILRLRPRQPARRGRQVPACPSAVRRVRHDRHRLQRLPVPDRPVVPSARRRHDPGKPADDPVGPSRSSRTRDPDRRRHDLRPVPGSLADRTGWPGVRTADGRRGDRADQPDAHRDLRRRRDARRRRRGRLLDDRLHLDGGHAPIRHRATERRSDLPVDVGLRPAAAGTEQPRKCRGLSGDRRGVRRGPDAVRAGRSGRTGPRHGDPVRPGGPARGRSPTARPRKRGRAVRLWRTPQPGA